MSFESVHRLHSTPIAETGPKTNQPLKGEMEGTIKTEASVASLDHRDRRLSTMS